MSDDSTPIALLSLSRVWVRNHLDSDGERSRRHRVEQAKTLKIVLLSPPPPTLTAALIMANFNSFQWRLTGVNGGII